VISGASAEQGPGRGGEAEDQQEDADEPARAVEAELSFLRRHLLDPSPEDRHGPAPADSALHRGGRA
jgi:hypothetical protein